MVKRLRRLRKFANQVVEVTRRIERICACCGAVTEETRRDIVPVSSVIAGKGTMTPRTVSPVHVPKAICCSCPWRLYANRRQETFQEQHSLLFGEATQEFVEATPSHSYDGEVLVTEVSTDHTRLLKKPQHSDTCKITLCPNNVTDEVISSTSCGSCKMSVHENASNTKSLDEVNNIPVNDSDQANESFEDCKEVNVSNSRDLSEHSAGSEQPTSQLTHNPNTDSSAVQHYLYNEIHIPAAEHFQEPIDRPDDVTAGPGHILSPRRKKVTIANPVYSRFRSTDWDHCDYNLKTDTDQTVSVSPTRSPSPLRSLSQTSQTDDFVAFRFLTRKPYLGTTSFPGCSQCAVGITPQQKYEKYFRVNPVPECPDSETTLEMARRHAYNQAQIATTSSTATLQKYQGITLKFPLSEFVCPPVTAPTDLRVEYALNKEWYRIYPIEWSIQQNITTNKSGPVDLAMLGEYNKQIALKTLDAETSKRESELIMECQGPFVVQLCACLVQADRRYLCMTYYNRRDLGKWMKRDEKRKYFGPEESLWICGYILAAIEFLHDKEILHLDIKPGNILIHNKGYPVVGDFGSSRRIHEFEEDTGRFAFTLAYASPEVMAGVKPDRLADLWPLACIFYELLATKTPFRRTNDIAVQLMQTLETTPDVSKFSATAQDYITLQLRRQKTERLGYMAGAREVMKHPIFKALDWAEVKYAHRHSKCRLLAVFNQIERDEREEKNKPGPIPPNPFLIQHLKKNKNGNNNNTIPMLSPTLLIEFDRPSGICRWEATCKIAQELYGHSKGRIAVTSDSATYGSAHEATVHKAD